MEPKSLRCEACTTPLRDRLSKLTECRSPGPTPLVFIYVNPNICVHNISNRLECRPDPRMEHWNAFSRVRTDGRLYTHECGPIDTPLVESTQFRLFCGSTGWNSARPDSEGDREAWICGTEDSSLHVRGQAHVSPQYGRCQSFPIPSISNEEYVKKCIYVEEPSQPKTHS